MSSRLLGKLLHLLYKCGLRRTYKQIDRIQYLKRLKRGRKPDFDRWLYSEEDIHQLSSGDILIRSRFGNKPVMFVCNERQYIERHIIRHGLYAPHILEVMSDFAQDGTTVLDVGANVGAYAVPLAKTREDVEIHAFEPNPHAAVRFRRNVLLNRVENVRIHEVGVGEKEAVLELNAYKLDDLGISSFVTPPSASPSENILVKIVSLDDTFAENSSKISLIKIDVQGFEYQVLKGAQAILDRDRPYIIMEHEDSLFGSREQAAEIKEMLRGLFQEKNYQVFYMTRYDPFMLFPVIWEKSINGDLLAIPQ